MRLLFVGLTTVVVTGILVFLYFRDTRMLVSRSPDGQIQITLWDRADLFGDDLRVTVNRAGHEQFLYKHLNDNCGPPRQGHVLWTPDSQSAVFFLCDGLCAPTLVLYDAKTNRVEERPEVNEITSILIKQYGQPTSTSDQNDLNRSPWFWACKHE
jgi:hypothetical protein